MIYQNLPSQSAPAPIPIVGIEIHSDIIFAKAAGIPSSTIAKTPAASRLFASSIRCLADSRDLP